LKIKSLHLENFKRFTDLKIDLSQQGKELPKLVLLIGANGSGKSAVFDAFELASTEKLDDINSDIRNSSYYLKSNSSKGAVNILLENQNKLTVSYDDENIMSFQDFAKKEDSLNFKKDLFYGRSAIRNTPRLTRTSIGNAQNIIDQNLDKPLFYIDADQRFENDLDVVIKQVADFSIKIVFEGNKDSKTELGNFLIEINDSLKRVFGEDESINLHFIKPVTPADGEPIDLIFKKGNSEISYDLLSSGEKEIVNILFNLYVRTKVFKNTIYFFDELDAHLHTSLQYKLIKEVVEHWIPESSQVWIATHSLGFIQYAHEVSHAAVIDFDHFNFDESVTLKPQKENENFEIAVPKSVLSVLFEDKKIILCENKNAVLLNSMGLKDTVFLADADKSSIILRLEQQEYKSIFGLIDRDFISDQETLKLKKKLPNLAILDFYCFENYLYHPNNLVEIYSNFNKKAYIQRIVEAKNADKNYIVRKLENNRNSYIFFKSEKNLIQNTSEGWDAIKDLLESDDFEDFYKVFSMKGRGNLCGIKNLRNENLVKTNWFKIHIIDILVHR
jgi:AAA15 family ATPase/GTPase